MNKENVDALKRNPSGYARLTYKLKNADVYVSAGGFHFIDYLDPVEDLPPETDASQPTGETAAYIETQLQANERKFIRQAEILEKHLPLTNAKVLDIGCGGGLFLAALKREGAHVTGIELSDTRAHYAKSKHGIEVVKRPIEDEYWGTFANSFDIVTLWDVIEHVNFPQATLKAAARTLKPGGVLLIDTPCRDAFYHRFGELTYRLSRGRYPTFLNAMYSAKPFGHKQILSLAEMRGLLEEAGLQVIELKRFHELSFPYAFYLKKLVRSESLVKILLPFVRLFFVVFPIRNKMLAAGRKK